MKSKGFTIAELLVALGIIGVIAAIMLPTISRLRPDENKINYLKAYDAMSNVISKLASDSTLYPLCTNTFGKLDMKEDTPVIIPLKCDKYPLMNFDNVNGSGNGDTKLCSLMARFLHADNIDCEEGPYEFSLADYTNNFSSPSFVLANGMRWRVIPAVKASRDEDTGTFQTDIYIDVNGERGPNCIYTNNCKRPDIFKFMVSASGKITPADPMGIEYIKTRRDLKVRDYDIDDDATILSTIGDERTFNVEYCE